MTTHHHGRHTADTITDEALDELYDERDRARRIAVALENEIAAHDPHVAQLRERTRAAQAAALSLRAQTPTAAQATLDHIRAARTWSDVWVQLGMYYGMKPEQAGAEARNRREGGVIQHLADAEQRVRAATRRAAHAEAERDRYRLAWLSARRRAEEASALEPARIQTCRACGSGYTLGEPCSTCSFHALMAAAAEEADL